MLIIGCDFHPSFQQIAMLMWRPGNTQGRNCRMLGERRRSFIAVGKGKYVWVSRPRVARAGPNAYWKS